MTNSEYFEKNNVSFTEALKLFNEQKKNGIRSFDKFLASKHAEHKFKVGDIVVLQLNEETKICGWSHNAVMKITEINEFYYTVRMLTPDGHSHIDDAHEFLFKFIDNNCIKY